MVRDTALPLRKCQQPRLTLDKYRFELSLDPPKSPLRRGTLTGLVPPFLRGARGDQVAQNS